MLEQPTIYSLNLRGKLLPLNPAAVMGIVNLTPDSFYDGSRAQSSKEVVEICRKMLAEGADILDLGAASSRPGAEEVPEKEEINRLLPALEAVRHSFPDAFISVDTFRASVAEEALKRGVHIINDISGGEDPYMLQTVARHHGAAWVLMHTRGNPRTMTDLAHYDDLLLELDSYFANRLHTARQAGILDVIIDPGFGFAKTTAHNFELLRRLGELSHLNAPILAGVSRKGMIWRTLDIKPENALNGSTVLHTLALLNGAHILRVHDVRAAVEARELLNHYIKRGEFA